MAERGDTDDQSKSRRVRLMCPHPPRPFQPYRGPPVAEGTIIAVRPVLGTLFQSWMKIHFLENENNVMMLRVDCAFHPYSENWISASVDLHTLRHETWLQAFPLVFSIHVVMIRLSVIDNEIVHIPYRRSSKSASSAFCSNGNQIGWSGTSDYNVYEYLENICRNISSTSQALCGAFSPDGRYLVLLLADRNRLLFRFYESSTLTFVICGFSNQEYVPPTRPRRTSIEENPVHLLWSKCGRFLGMSTYFRELFLFKVKGMTNAEVTCCSRVPSIRSRGEFLNISHPAAYDFASRVSEKDKEQEVTVIAVGTDDCCVRVCQVDEKNMKVEVLIEKDLVDNQAARSDLIINCLRFSNAQDFLAVALSSGDIDLLDSMSLLPIKSLQSVSFRITKQPEGMPYYRGFSSLSFSCSDNFLAAGATDGLVRVWCVRRPIGPLLALCRTVIRSCCKLEDMNQLHLPPIMVSYLTDTAF